MELSQILIEEMTIKSGQQEVFDSNFPHCGSFGLRISYGGKKSFFYVYKLGGQRRRLTLGQHPTISLIQARTIADKYATQVSFGRDPKLELKALGKAQNLTTLAKWFFKSSETLSPATIREYRRIFLKEIEPYFATRPPSSIENKEITALIRRIGIERGKKTLANRTRALLHRMFSFAIEQGVLLNNPVVDTSAYIVADKPKKLLDLEQIKLLWNYLEQLNVSLSGMFRLLILSAQVPRRIQALDWSDIRLEQLQFADIKSLPIPLSPSAIHILKGLRFPNGKHEKVFGDFGYQHYSSMQRHFKSVCQDAKLDNACNINTLRRSIEFQLRRMGTNHFVVSYIMQKKTEVERLKGLKALNLESEARAALERWAKLVLLDSPKASTPSKIIQLFPKKEL